MLEKNVGGSGISEESADIVASIMSIVSRDGWPAGPRYLDLLEVPEQVEGTLPSYLT